MDKNLDYYMSLPYRAEVLPDQEEGGYALRCPELPGCLTCAETLEAVLDFCLPGGWAPCSGTRLCRGLQRAVQAADAEIPPLASGSEVPGGGGLYEPVLRLSAEQRGLKGDALGRICVGN